MTLPSSLSPLRSTDLIAHPQTRECILIAGKDSAGKSCAVVSLARWVQQVLTPAAQFFVIDTENKFRAAFQSFGAEAPGNVIYYKVESMNQITEAFDAVVAAHHPGDWLAVESMARVWERAQDLGYQAVTGTSKVAYLDKRRAAGPAKGGIPVTPQPDHLWNITKGAHDAAFLDPISQSETLNAVLTTTLQRPPKADGFIKENADRKAARAEFGIDAGLDGTPRLPYYFQTLCLLDRKAGAVTCRVVRDDLSVLEQPWVEFPVETRTRWAQMFWTTCR